MRGSQRTVSDGATAATAEADLRHGALRPPSGPDTECNKKNGAERDKTSDVVRADPRRSPSDQAPVLGIGRLLSLFHEIKVPGAGCGGSDDRQTSATISRVQSPLGGLDVSVEYIGVQPFTGNPLVRIDLSLEARRGSTGDGARSCAPLPAVIPRAQASLP